MLKEKKLFAAGELVLVGLISFLVTVILYYPVFFKDSIAVNHSDAIVKYLGYYSHAAKTYLDLRIPLWNPFINLGHSIFSSPCSPFTILIIPYLFLLPEFANTVSVIFCLWLLFFASWIYFRVLGFKYIPSLFGCIVYALSGPVFFLHSYYPFMLGFSLLPLSLSFLMLWDRTKRTHLLAGFGIIVTLASLSVSPDIMGYFMFCIILNRLAFISAKRQNIASSFKYIFSWGTFLFLTYLINSVHIIPLIEWLSYSTRGTMVHGTRFYPNFMNLLSAVSVGKFVMPHPFDSYYFYIGLPAIIMGFIGSRNSKNTFLSRFFLLTLILPGIYTVLWVLHYINITLFSYIDLLRGMFIFTLGLAGMAAQGSKSILDMRQENKTWKRITPSIIVFLLLISAFGRGIYLGLLQLPFLAHHKYLISSHEETFLPFPRHLESASGAGRLTNYGKNRIESTARYGIRVIPFTEGGYNKNLKYALEDKYKIITGFNKLSSFNDLRLVKPDGARLADYGVKFILRPNVDKYAFPQRYRDDWVLRKDIVLYPEDLRRNLYKVFENTHFRGRAYLVSSNGTPKKGNVIVEDLAGEKILCTISNASPGDKLIFADLAFPGWMAKVNGIPTAWSNYLDCIRQVNVPKGDSTVLWEYKPISFKIGLGVTVIALILSVSLLFIHIKRT